MKKKECEGWQWVGVGSREFDAGMVLEKLRKGRSQDGKREWHSWQREQHAQRKSRGWKRIERRQSNQDIVRKEGYREIRLKTNEGQIMLWFVSHNQKHGVCSRCNNKPVYAEELSTVYVLE